MVGMSQIEEMGWQIGREFRPERVVRFGSHAHGVSWDESDVDPLIILQFEGRSVDQSVQIRMKLRPAFPLDLLVQTPEAVGERLALGDDSMRKFLQETKVLYDADHR